MGVGKCSIPYTLPNGNASSSARLEGGGGGRPRRVGASARRINGRNGREGVGGGAVGGVGGEKQSREGEEGDKGDFAISKSSRD